MALRKRGAVWWVDITAPSGERIRCSAHTDNRSQAQEFHDRLKVETWRVAKLGEQPRRTWDEAALKWLEETSHKATHREDAAKLAWLQDHLSLRPLDALTRDLIAGIATLKVRESSPATANRYLALIRAILRRARDEWGWIERVPKISLYKEPKRRVRWLTHEQAGRLLDELPLHQRDVVLFALATGLRQSNVLRLEWAQVDMTRGIAWIHPDQAKARRAIHVPLNSVALAVLHRQSGAHLERVFTYKGQPIKQANTHSWRQALARAGIEDFRWHDLRHTWASWHAQSGTPLYVLQDLGAWRSESMVRRYAHLAPGDYATYAESVAAPLGSIATRESSS
ncbi:site-specific integrase [Metallibacterium sp.]|uniref:tyrosine-type recombinase/integrase n=1 Tax=Metallibacterium sp. TaxID=2940281 RepID=UPI002609CAE1|nr:site-specific integrase [Metallibacterium sp.]